MTRIVAYGAGSALKDFLSVAPETIELVCLMESAPSASVTEDGLRIAHVDEIATLDFDYVVITARAVDAIRSELIRRGVADDRIVAFYPSFSGELSARANRDIAILNDRIGCALPPIGLATMYLDPQPDRVATPASSDFVRDESFRLAARQIARNGVAGAVAELGVYQGDQAALINRLFPDRTLYLFDTFTGFDASDVSADSGRGFSRSSTADFTNTSVELVLGKLPFADRARPVPGFFPTSTAGIEDRFAFVSLDVDLYEPTLAGLEWFYPRLNDGGYIFVHDYNNVRFTGVRHAVDRFVAATGCSCVPIPDFAGSVVIQR